MAEFYELGLVEAARAAEGLGYLEFLRAPSLSLGLYVLPVGADDRQQPHAEDEVYYVIGGRARFRAGEKDHCVEPGSILFVEAGVEHRFYDIDQDLQLLVFFAPPESAG